jgi:hypothetical protein
MKARSAFVAAMTLGAFSLLAAEPKIRQADRQLLGRLHYSSVPALRMDEVPVERAITRYLAMLAAEWHDSKPLPYRVERSKRQPQQQPLPAEPGETVMFSFSERGFVDALRELISLTDWSFTVRDGVIIFSNTPDLYRDEIWQRPILKPK